MAHGVTHTPRMAHSVTLTARHERMAQSVTHTASDIGMPTDLELHTRCNTLQRQTHCNTLQRHTHCNTLQRHTHCNTLQRHTHCNTLQRHCYAYRLPRCIIPSASYRPSPAHEYICVPEYQHVLGMRRILYGYPYTHYHLKRLETSCMCRDHVLTTQQTHTTYSNVGIRNLTDVTENALLTPENPPNRKTRIPRYTVKSDQNLNLNLYREILWNRSAPMWWNAGKYLIRILKYLIRIEVSDMYLLQCIVR